MPSTLEKQFRSADDKNDSMDSPKCKRFESMHTKPRTNQASHERDGPERYSLQWYESRRRDVSQKSKNGIDENKNHGSSAGSAWRLPAG